MTVTTAGTTGATVAAAGVTTGTRTAVAAAAVRTCTWATAADTVRSFCGPPPQLAGCSTGHYTALDERRFFVGALLAQVRAASKTPHDIGLSPSPRVR